MVSDGDRGRDRDKPCSSGEQGGFLTLTGSPGKVYSPPCNLAWLCLCSAWRLQVDTEGDHERVL